MAPRTSRRSDDASSRAVTRDRRSLTIPQPPAQPPNNDLAVATHRASHHHRASRRQRKHNPTPPAAHPPPSRPRQDVITSNDRRPPPPSGGRRRPQIHRTTVPAERAPSTSQPSQGSARHGSLPAPTSRRARRRWRRSRPLRTSRSRLGERSRHACSVPSMRASRGRGTWRSELVPRESQPVGDRDDRIRSRSERPVSRWVRTRGRAARSPIRCG
jgi:hypothetical protein